MFVTDLQSNFKGLKSVKLTPCTLIKGRNKTGKSSLIDAYSLLLTGECHSPHVGKSTKTVWKGKPSRDQEVRISALLSDDTHLEWKLESPLKKLGPEKAWGISLTPLTLALLYGQPERLLPAAMKAVDVRTEFDVAELVPDEYSSLLTHYTNDDFSMENILKVLPKVSRDKKRVDKQIADAEKDLKTYISEPTFTEKKLQLFEDYNRRYLKGGVSNETSDAEQEAVRTDLSRLRAGLIPLKHIQEVHEYVLKNESKGCPICSSQINLDVVKEIHRIATLRITGIESRIEQLTEKVQSVGLTPKQREVHQQLTIEKNAHDNYFRRQQDVVEFSKKSRAIGAIRSALKAYQIEAGRTAFQIIEKRVNRLLPKDLRIKIDVDNEVVHIRTSNDFSFELCSGMERAMIVTAFAQALTPKDAPPIRFCIIDEVWPDTVQAKRLMGGITRMLQEGGFTQILMSVVTWGKKVPDGWSLIDLDKGGEENAE